MRITRSILRWERKELWCLAWRTERHRGHHTNNFAEVTVRLYKVKVLGRAKAYNAVSLVDFTVRVMEDYYRCRLRDFANGRISAERLALEKLSRKASYLTTCDQIDDFGENRYGVPNSDSTEKYDVDATLGCCSCKAGMFGKFCKHQLAIMTLFHKAFPNVPGVMAGTRHSIAYIALGETCPHVHFYNNFQPVNAVESLQNRSTGITEQCTVTTEELLEPTSHNTVEDNISTSPLVEEYCKLLRELYSRFGDTTDCQRGLEKAVCRLRNVSSASSLASFMHSPGCTRRYRAGAAIRVQPTALARRRPNVTRGSKRLASGRPPSGSSVANQKRRRCLSLNIRANVPNAKSHGVGH